METATQLDLGLRGCPTGRTVCSNLSALGVRFASGHAIPRAELPLIMEPDEVPW